MRRLSRRQLRGLILREMAEKQVPPEIARKAQKVGQGYIVDVTQMEGSGGGYYPGYKVKNGMATLDTDNVGDLVYMLMDTPGLGISFYQGEDEDDSPPSGDEMRYQYIPGQPWKHET